MLVVLFFGVLTINFYWLVDAYGSGAPYYSRTTNMDKWSNPIPVLLILDISTILLICVGMTYIKKRVNK